MTDDVDQDLTFTLDLEALKLPGANRNVSGQRARGLVFENEKLIDLYGKKMKLVEGMTPLDIMRTLKEKGCNPPQYMNGFYDLRPHIVYHANCEDGLAAIETLIQEYGKPDKVFDKGTDLPRHFTYTEFGAIYRSTYSVEDASALSNACLVNFDDKGNLILETELSYFVQLFDRTEQAVETDGSETRISLSEKIARFIRKF